jgi:opacity protein-like surface antigen
MKLNRVLLSSAAVIAMAGAANAADLVVYDVPVSEPVIVADTGWYLSVFGGAVWDSFLTAEDDDVDTDTDDVEIGTGTGWTLGVAVGAHVFDNIRGELELAHSSRDVTSATEGAITIDPLDGSVSTTTLMGNLWVDLDTGSGFTPYIGGGLGIGYIAAESPGDGGEVTPLDADGIGLAYQVGAGVQFEVANNVALDLGYRFKGVSADISGTGTEDVPAHIGSHVLQVGVKVGF